MTADTRAALVALKERVDAATGADRTLDGDIVLALGGPPDTAFPFQADVDWKYRGNGEWVTPSPRSIGLDIVWKCPPYTASIDAAIDLIGRQLPEWQIVSFTMGWRGPGKLYDRLPEEWRKHYAKAQLEVACVAEVRRSEHGYIGSQGESRTAPLALLSALLAALIQEAGDAP